MTRLTTNVTGIALALTVLLALGGCSVGDGSGLTYSSPLAESPQSASASSSNGTAADN
jgi:hypothetical protein